MKAQWGILFSVALAALIFRITDSGGSENRSQSVGYWLWAGITPDLAPPNSELYVLQGHFLANDQHFIFEHLGVYPHPINCSRLILVYRFEGALVDPQVVDSTYRRDYLRWAKHGIKVSGLQIDFDCPTNRIREYTEYLRTLSAILPDQCFLSSTALGDWALSGNPEALTELAKSVDELVFQLYHGNSYVEQLKEISVRLPGIGSPFRIGLLSNVNAPPEVQQLKQSSNCVGILYFVSKGVHE